MQFTWDWMLPSLLIVPLLIGVYIWAMRRRARYVVRFSSLAIVKDALGKQPKWRRHIPPFLLLLAITIMLLGLARPVAVVIVPKPEATVILTIDVSGSMRAPDIQPTRIEAAKSAARAFVQLQDKTTAIGVVAFSGNASLVQAPTTDKEAVLAAINKLTVQRSTAIGWGILTSLDAIFQDPEIVQTNAMVTGSSPTPIPDTTPVPLGTHVAAIVILLTDGQNVTGPSPIEATEQAAMRGVRIFTIGVGTTTGATVGGGGNTSRGFRTALDEKTLQRIADMTDAKYFHASDAEALHTIYRNLDTILIVATEKTELTMGFTAVAMVLTLVALSFSFLWFGRLP
ncbi:MAG: VWA domain-containing protein [Chloroflexi bacterium]|nr:VWA domain-containing protein [Chloroflexota bacterium]